MQNQGSCDQDTGAAGGRGGWWSTSPQRPTIWWVSDSYRRWSNVDKRLLKFPEQEQKQVPTLHLPGSEFSTKRKTLSPYRLQKNTVCLKLPFDTDRSRQVIGLPSFLRTNSLSIPPYVPQSAWVWQLAELQRSFCESHLCLECPSPKTSFGKTSPLQKQPSLRDMGTFDTTVRLLGLVVRGGGHCQVIKSFLYWLNKHTVLIFESRKSVPADNNGWINQPDRPSSSGTQVKKKVREFC